MVNLDLWFVIVTFDQSSNHQFERWFGMTIDMTTWKLFKENDHGRSWSLHNQGHYVCTLHHESVQVFGQYNYTIFNWFGTHHPVLSGAFPIRWSVRRMRSPCRIQSSRRWTRTAAWVICSWSDRCPWRPLPFIGPPGRSYATWGVGKPGNA